jgi:copper resistance protein D
MFRNPQSAMPISMLCLLLARWANIYSSSLLLSLLAFRRLYLIPVSDLWHRDLTEKRYGDALTWICWSTMSISGIVWLLAVVASVTDSGIEWGTAAEVIGVTQFGHLWLFRSLLGLAIAGGLLYDALRKEPRSYSDLPWIALATVNLVSAAWAGHAGAATGLIANFHVFTDLVHLLASAVWPGGLLPLTVWFLVNAKKRQKELLDHTVLHRFSAISLGGVAVVATTGLLNSFFMLKKFSDLYATTYGQILTGKIVLFLLMIGLGAQNRRLLKIRQRSERHAMDRTNAGRLFCNVCAESVLAFVVFGLAGALGAIAPPV